MPEELAEFLQHRRDKLKKLKEKNPDMIIANRLEAIGADKSTVLFKTANSRWHRLSMLTRRLLRKK